MATDPWRRVSAVPELGAAEVHVWLDELSVAAPWATGDLLSLAEQEQAARMSAVARRAVFVRGRSALRFLAGHYLGVAPGDVPVRILDLGKPVLDSVAGRPSLAVSVAHSGDLIAIAFAYASNIGVDIEGEDPSVDRGAIARRFFSKAEAAAIAALPESAEHEAFFALWVRKEALLKAAGDGLSVPLAEVELEVSRDAEPRLIRLPTEFGPVADWSVRGISPGAGMAGAVAVRGPVTYVSCVRLTF